METGLKVKPMRDCCAAILLYLIGCVGCGSTVADADVVETVPPGAVESVAPSHAAEAIAVALGTYERATGVQVLPADVTVHWSATLLAYGISGASGLTYNCGDIWVVANPDAASIPYVLAHELGHCARMTLTGDGDAEHTDSVWWGSGGVVDQAHHAVRVFGL